jgi:DNA-binding NarL/FixJ family response regulator
LIPLTITTTDELTERQREVVTLIADGLTLRELACALGVTVEGVKSHVSEILQRTGLRRRVQLVSYAYQRGLTEDRGHVAGDTV